MMQLAVMSDINGLVSGDEDDRMPLSSLTAGDSSMAVDEGNNVSQSPPPTCAAVSPTTVSAPAADSSLLDMHQSDTQFDSLPTESPDPHPDSSATFQSSAASDFFSFLPASFDPSAAPSSSSSVNTALTIPPATIPSTLPPTTFPSLPATPHPHPLDTAALLATRRPPAEDDCCVCFNGDSEDTDPILFCDGPGCTAVVHQSCYGVMAIPDGDWLCDSCVIKANPTLAADTPLLLKTLDRCMLCPDTTGAFKPTADGRGWVHASCAIWTPETGFRDAEKVDAVIGIETIDKRRWRLVCEICRVKRGSCVQCMGRHCSFSCHVTCGWKGGLRLEMQAVGQGDELEVYKLVYCDKHRNEPWQKSGGRWGRGRQRAVRPNDGDESNAADNINSGYQCVRCGSRRRRHECQRELVGDEMMEVEADEEKEDSELLQLWEERNERETLEERMEREEDERDMDRLWEAERQSLVRDREQKRREDRERREKEREDRLARGESTLYEEMKQAQEEAEEKYAMGDGLESERPVSITKRRKRRERSSGTAAPFDGEWKDEKGTEKAESKEADEAGSPVVKRRMGRPAGSMTRIRKCLHHRALKERCGRACPYRPPPFTEAELKARVEERDKRGPRGSKREVRRKMEDAMRMTTSAPGQRKVIRADINVQLSDGQQPRQEKKEAPATPASSSAASSPTGTSSPSNVSVPLSSLNALPPPPFAHPIAPTAVVSNPIAAPPALVVPPLASSAALVVPRPNAPYLYNTRDGAELSRRVLSLLTASTPDQQRLQLKQLLSDSPPSYCRLVTQRLREQKAEAVLLHWLREGREQRAWALIQEVLSALVRLVTTHWDEKVANAVVAEVFIHREGVSEGCKKEANAVWKRLVEVGWVKEASKAEAKSRDAFTMALQAGQLNGVLPSTAPVNGNGAAASDKRSKVVKLPAFTNGDSTSTTTTQQHTTRTPSHTSPTAAMYPSKQTVNAARAVGMTSERYRQRAIQEEAEKRGRAEAERRREREFQAGLSAAYPPQLQPQPHCNGGWNALLHPVPQSHGQLMAADSLAALGALTGHLFAAHNPPSPPPSHPAVSPLGPPTLPAAAQSQMADALQAAAMLQAQLQQRAGGLGAFAGLQALNDLLRNGSVHGKR